MGAMGVMALALSVVGGAIGAGLGVGALSGMWGIPAVVAVATVGVVTVGVVGGWRRWRQGFGCRVQRPCRQRLCTGRGRRARRHPGGERLAQRLWG